MRFKIRAFSSLLAIFLLNDFAHALVPGPYVGLFIGESFTNYSSSSVGLSSASSVTNSGFSGGALLGYQLTPYWGADLAYIQYNSSRFQNMNDVSGVTGTIDQNAVQLMLKGTLPITDNGFSVSAKGGVAYLSSKASSEFPNNDNDVPDQSRYTFAYALGVSYDITTSLPLELFWNQTLAAGNMQRADLVGLSLSYYFF